MLQQRQAKNEHLLWLGVVDTVIDDRALLENGHKKSPGDPAPMVGLARLALRDNDPKTAKELLEKALQVDSSQIEAQVRMGEALLDGKITQVIGPVVDVEFPTGGLPKALVALKLTNPAINDADAERPSGRRK